MRDCALIDIRKAFDSVEHRSLGMAVWSVGLPEALCKLIGGMFTENILSIRDHVSGRTNTICPGRGVIQGDPLYPLLFVLVLDMAVAESGAFKGGIPIPSGRRHRALAADNIGNMSGGDDGVRLSLLAYADDIIAVAEIRNELQLSRLEVALAWPVTDW